MPGTFLGFDTKYYYIPNLVPLCAVSEQVSGNRLFPLIIAVDDVDNEVPMTRNVLV